MPPSSFVFRVKILFLLALLSSKDGEIVIGFSRVLGMWN